MIELKVLRELKVSSREILPSLDNKRNGQLLQIPSRSVRFIRKSPKLSNSFDFCPPFIDCCDEAYELIQSNLNIKFYLIFNFFLLTILKFQLKKGCQRRLVGSTHRQGLQEEIRVDRRELISLRL